ncbi:1-acyl-sn-glycerol-3-phosphate acyltransferase [bacterium]|nr:1-acyl-sn-glycerol-3-phosphate acyltransferase [bacterium]MDA9361243.1 1-acyl-sn-glycerol-3-phosphate acyltransferase [Flavobacteriaceae bacterium]
MLKIIQKIALLLWRVWFYVLAAIPIITLFPILLLIASHKNGYPTLYWIARNVWSPFILIGMGFYIRTKFAKPLPEGTSYLLVANHSSYLDPFVMFRVSKNPFVFVGKKEFIKVPLFGSIYKRAAILVDRSSSKSRWGVYERANKIIAQGRSVCIFPEVNYADDTILLNPFKRGAFKLAIEHQIPIVPMTFLDCKRKFPWSPNFGFPGELRVETFPEINPVKSMGELEELQEKTRDIILNGLNSDVKQRSQKAVIFEEIKAQKLKQ